MLCRVLNDMAERNEPFTYLIPADKAYYEPFDFVFVMDWTETEITGEEGAVTGSLEPFREDDTQEVLRFLNRQIRSYDIYTVINPDYLKQAAKEAKSQDGDLMVFREHGEIAGVFAYGKEKDTIYVRLGFGTEEKRFLEMISRTFPGSKIEILAGCVKRGSKVPKIMFRITSLEALCRCLRSRKKIEFVLTVTDPVIGKNNGTFLFSASKDGTEICPSSKKAEGELSIGDFSKAVFGYSGEDVLERHPFLRELIPLDAVYITEEV